MIHERSDYTRTHEGESCNGFRPRRWVRNGLSIELSIPRTRSGSFTPYLLSIIRNESEQRAELFSRLYSKGLTTEDIGEIAEFIYGRAYSKQQVSSLASRCKEDVEQWLNRQLEAHYLAFYINAIFVPTRSEGKVSHQAYYTILGIREDGSREVLSLVHHPTEGASCWQSVLEELKERGVLQVDLVISDALTGIETAIRLYFPRPTTSSVSYTSNAAFATPSLPKTSLRFSTNWGRSFRWSSPTSPRPWAMKPFSTSLSGGRRNTSLSNAIDTPET